MLKLDIPRFRLDRVQDGIQSIQRCLMIIRAVPLNLRKLANLCLLIIALFTLRPVNCQGINQIHSSREIYRMNSYKNAQIFRYFIPSDTSHATWSFISNTSLNCDHVDVTVYLRYRGIPVINFDNVTDQDILIDDEEQYKIEFKANGQEFKFNLSKILFGEWYAIAYFNKSLVFNDVGDQVLNSIVEKTEIFDCRAWLSSNLNFNRTKGITRLQFDTKYTDRIHNAKLFQFFVPMNAYSLNVNITRCKPIGRNSDDSGYCPITLYLRGSGIPNRKVNDKEVHCTNQESCHLRSLNLVRSAEDYYLVIELQDSENLDPRFLSGAHVTVLITADSCHENVQLEEYIQGIPMIISPSTTEKTIEDGESTTVSSTTEGTFIAKKRNQIVTSEPIDYYMSQSTVSTTEYTIPSTTTTTSTTTPRPTTTSTTPSTTTTTTTTQRTTTQTPTTSTEKLILRNKKPMVNQPLPQFVVPSTTTTTQRPITSTEKNYIYSATDIIASASSDDFLNYAKMPKMKQPAQKKDSYPGNTNRIPINKPPQFDKEFSENIETQSNKEEKDYEDENENEEELDEDEENEEEEEVLNQNKHNFRNKNHSNKVAQQSKPNQRNQHNQFRGNQVHNSNRNHQMKFNQNVNNPKHRSKPAHDDDEEEINQYTKERVNRKPYEYDFTRRNASRGRVQRAAWQLENSIFQSELSRISFVDQCPYRLQFSRHNLPGNFNFKFSQSSTSANSRHAEAFIQVPNTNLNHLQNTEKETKLSLVQFEIVPLLDVGGMLEIELNLNIDFDTAVNNVSVIACLKHNRIATSLNDCLSKLQVNSTNMSQNKISKTLIPYPKSGHYFISIISFCHKNTQLPYHGLSGHSSSIGQESKNCDHPHSSVLLNIKSESCNENEDICPSKRGTCKNELQNGLPFSYCECRPSHYGFRCSHTLRSTSNTKEHIDNYTEEVQQQLLIELLVLTLSNLLWIPVIIIAFYKALWVESLVYILTMFVTTSFHACSSTSIYAICLINPVTLEFGCLFISCLCICVTIISLSDMGLSLKCILDMFAAIWTSLLIHLQWSPFWMMVFSSILFSLLMFTSWLVNCCRGSCFPSLKLWFFSIIPALTTLICASSLQLYPTEPILPKWIADSVFNLLLPVSVLFLIYSINNRKKIMASSSNLSHVPSTRVKEGQSFGKGISSDTYYELITEGASHLSRNPQYIK